MQNHSRYNQLDLLADFDKGQRRDKKLVDDLIAAVRNFKYFRINTRASDLKEKKQIEELLSGVMYWTAFLAWRKARYVEPFKATYKDNYNLDYFLKITQDHPDTGVLDILSPEELAEYYMNGNKRLKTLFMVYKDLLQDEKVITKRILDNFNTIHNLTHAI